MHNRLTFRAMLLATAGLMSPSIAQADQAQSGAPVADEARLAESDPSEIVVTAQRREQRLEDVPISVTVATGESIERLGLNSLPDVTQRMANVKLVPSASSDFLSIRGLGSGGNAGFEQAVATFVDGVYRSRSRSVRSALFDIERLEVLKGPQSTFFGNNATAGALNITTRTPGDVFAYNASALYAPTDGEFIFEAGVDLPVADTFAIRVAGQASGMDGYIHNDFQDDMTPRLRNLAGRISAVWRPTDSIRSHLRVDRVRQRDQNAFPLEVFNCPPPAGYPFDAAGSGTCARYLRARPGSIDTQLDWRSQDDESLFNMDMTEVAWSNSIDFGNATLTSTTGYFRHDNVLVLDTQPFPLTAAEQTATPVNASRLGPVAVGERYNSFSQELRLESRIGRLEYTLGAYYSDANLDIRNQVAAFWTTDFAGRTGGVIPAGTPVVSTNDQREDVETLSFFVAGTWNISDSLRLNGGLRYSRVEKDAVRGVILGTSGGLIYDTFTPFTEVQQAALRPLLGVDTRNFESPNMVDQRWLPSASIQYDLAPRITAYASYATGFKAGGFGIGLTRLTFDEETVESFEVGLRGRPFPGFYFTSAIFSTTFDDLQVASPQVQANGTIQNNINNAASARSRGIEVGAEWRISPQITIRGEASYLDAEFVSFPSGTCTVLQTIATPSGCIQDLSGRPRAYAPNWSGSAGFTYTLPVTDTNQLRLDTNLYFSSGYYQQDTIDSLFYQDGFAKLDMRLGFGPANRAWELAVIGKNLTDVLTTGYKQTIGTSPGSVLAIPERRRSVALQFTIRG